MKPFRKRAITILIATMPRVLTGCAAGGLLPVIHALGRVAVAATNPAPTRVTVAPQPVAGPRVANVAPTRAMPGGIAPVPVRTTGIPVASGAVQPVRLF